MAHSSELNEQQIRNLLEAWAQATREGRQDEVLLNHAPDVLIYDVLPPMKYESAKVYRDSWGDWQPTTVGDNIFEFQDLQITAGQEVGFAHAFICCGGKTAGGKTFEDIVRATFCLKKIGNDWRVVHQHISKPVDKGGK